MNTRESPLFDTGRAHRTDTGRLGSSRTPDPRGSYKWIPGYGETGYGVQNGPRLAARALPGKEGGW
jgi:hypothetical protein